MAVNLEEVRRQAIERSKENKAQAVKSAVNTETNHRIATGINAQSADEVDQAAKTEIPGEQALRYLYSGVSDRSKIERDKVTLQTFNKLEKEYDGYYEAANNYFTSDLVSNNRNVARNNYLRILQVAGKTHDGVSFGEKGWNEAEAEDINAELKEIVPHFNDVVYEKQLVDVVTTIINISQGRQLPKDVAIIKRYEDLKASNPNIWHDMLDAVQTSYNDAINMGLGQYPLKEDDIDAIRSAFAWADGEVGQAVINKRISDYGLKNVPAKVPGETLKRFTNKNHPAILAKERMNNLPGSMAPLSEEDIQKDITVGGKLSGRERYYYTSNYAGDGKDVWSSVPETVKNGIYTVWGENSKEFAEDVVDDPRVLNKLYKTAYMEEFFKNNPEAKLSDIYKTEWLSREDNVDLEEDFNLPGRDEVYMRLIQKNAPGITKGDTRRILRNIKKQEYDDAARIMKNNSGELNRTDIYEVNRNPKSMVLAGIYNTSSGISGFGRFLADAGLWISDAMYSLGEWGMIPNAGMNQAIQRGNIKSITPDDPKKFWDENPGLKNTIDFFLPEEEARKMADRFTKTKNYDKRIIEYIGNGEYGKAAELTGVEFVENLPQLILAFMAAMASGGTSLLAPGVGATGSAFAGRIGAATLASIATGSRYSSLLEQDYDFRTRSSNSMLWGISEYAFENFGTMFNINRLFNIQKRAVRDGIRVGFGRAAATVAKSYGREFGEEYFTSEADKLFDIITGVRNEFGELPRLFDGSSMDDGLVGGFTGGVLGVGGIMTTNVALKVEQRQKEIEAKKKEAFEKMLSDNTFFPSNIFRSNWKSIHYSRVDSWSAWNRIADEMLNPKAQENVHNRTTGTGSEVFTEQVDGIMSEAEDLSGTPVDVADTEFTEEAVDFVNQQANKTLPEAQTYEDVSYIGRDGEVLAKGEKGGISEAFKDDTGTEVDMMGFEDVENPAETAWMNIGNIVINPESSEIMMMKKPNRKQSAAMRRYMSERKEFTITIVGPDGNVFQTKDYPPGTLPAQAMRDVSAYFNSGYNLQPQYRLALEPSDVSDEAYIQERLPALALARGSVRAKYVNPQTGRVDHTYQRKPGWRLAGEFVNVPKELLTSAPITKKGETKKLTGGLDELADKYNKMYGKDLGGYEFLELAMEEYEIFKSKKFQEDYSVWKTRQRYAERKAKLQKESVPAEERLAEAKESFLAEGTVPTKEESAETIYNNLGEDVVSELGMPEDELTEAIELTIEYLGEDNIANANLPKGKSAIDIMNEAARIKDAKEGVELSGELISGENYDEAVSAVENAIKTAEGDELGILNERLKVLKNNEQAIRKLSGEDVEIVESEADAEIAQNDKAQDDINRASAVAAANAELAADDGIIYPTRKKLAAMLEMKRGGRQGETPPQVILNETIKQERGIEGYEAIPEDDMQINVNFNELYEEINKYDPKNLTPDQKGKIELFLSVEPKNGDEGMLQSEIHDKYFKKEKSLSGDNLTRSEKLREKTNDLVSTAGANVSSFAKEITDRGARMEFNNLYNIARFNTAGNEMLVQLKKLKGRNKIAHDALLVALWNGNRDNAYDIIAKYGSRSNDPAVRDSEISALRKSIDQFEKVMDAAYEYAKVYFPNLRKVDFYFPRSVKNYKGLSEHIYNSILRNAGYSEKQIAGYKNMFQKMIEAENAKRARNKLPRLTEHEVGAIFETYINNEIFKKSPTTKGSKHTKHRMISFITPSMLKYYNPMAETVDEYFKSMVRAVEARSFLSDIAIKNRREHLIQKEADRIRSEYEDDPNGMQDALENYEKQLENNVLNREKVLEDVFGKDTPMLMDNYSVSIGNVMGDLLANNEFSKYQENRIEKYLSTLFGRKRMGAFASFLSNASYVGTLSQYKSAIRQFADIAFSMTFNGVKTTLQSSWAIAKEKYGQKFLSDVEAEANRIALIDVDQVMGDMNIMKNISEQSGISFSRATEFLIDIVGLTAVDSFFANTLMEGYARNMKDMLNKMTIDEKNNSIVIQIGDKIMKTIPLQFKDPDTGEKIDMSDPRTNWEKIKKLGGDMKVYRVESAIREMQRILGDSFVKTYGAMKSGDFSSADAKFMLYNQLRKTRPIGITDQPAFKTTSDFSKIFYVLKTFPLKLIDMWRQQIFREVNEGLRDGNIAQAANGMANGAKFILYFSLANASANFLIDFIMNRPFDIEDIFYDSSLEAIGFNRWQTWMFSEEMKRGKSPWSALGKVMAPPIINIGNDIWRSARRVVKGEDTLLQSGLFKYVPILGLYEAWFGRYALKYGRNKKPAQHLERILREMKEARRPQKKLPPGSPGYR